MEPVSVIRLHVRLYPEEDDDLIAWHEQLQDHGEKSLAIKQTLRQGIRAGVAPTAPPAAMDWGHLTQVVQEAISTSLVQWDARLTGAAPVEDEETAALLDCLTAALVLGGPEPT